MLDAFDRHEFDNPPKRLFAVWTNDPTLQDDVTGENTPRGNRYIEFQATLGHTIMHSKAYTPRTEDPQQAPNQTKQVVSARPARIKLSDSDKITVVAKKNPKKEGSNAYKRFELYHKSKTVKDFIAKGGSEADIRYDLRAGYISLN